MLETLDYTICIGNTPTFLYFDLYLYSAYAGHHVYYTLRSYCQPRLGAIVSWVLKQIPEVSILFLANQNLLSKSWWRNCCLSSNSKSKIKFEPFYKNPYKKIILANLEKSRFIYTPGNTGNIFLQLAMQQCCVPSWRKMLLVSLHLNEKRELIVARILLPPLNFPTPSPQTSFRVPDTPWGGEGRVKRLTILYKAILWS